MVKTHLCISEEQVAYHQSGHTLYYILRGIIPERVEIISAGSGMTMAEAPLFPYSNLTQDFISLAGTVAEHIYAGDFADVLELVHSGGIPAGADFDFYDLYETDCEVIAEMMMFLYDLFATERWLLLSAIAEELIEKRVLEKNEICRIVARLARINQNMERIGKLRKKRIYPECTNRRRGIEQFKVS